MNGAPASEAGRINPKARLFQLIVEMMRIEGMLLFRQKRVSDFEWRCRYCDYEVGETKRYNFKTYSLNIELNN